MKLKIYNETENLSLNVKKDENGEIVEIEIEVPYLLQAQKGFEHVFFSRDYKECSRCKSLGRRYKKAPEEFSLNRTSKDGLQTQCRQCRADRERGYQANRVQMREER